MPYSVSIQHVASRPLAVVRERVAPRDVPTSFRRSLDQVYAAAKSGAVSLDGQNIFVYRAAPQNLVDVEFGVGVRNAFAPVGRVTLSATPEGEAATTTHWGAYSGLGAAHAAVVSWCRDAGHSLTGVSWEVYGHWTDDPAELRTDIYYLVKPASRE